MGSRHDCREGVPAWFDADGFLLHEIEGELAGFCWTKIQEEEGEIMGEIYVIAVNPDFQGRGLGKQLVIAGLEYLDRAGMPTAMLYVDRDNREARGLYFALGFTDDHLDRAYTGDVAPTGAAPGSASPAAGSHGAAAPATTSPARAAPATSSSGGVAPGT